MNITYILISVFFLLLGSIGEIVKRKNFNILIFCGFVFYLYAIASRSFEDTPDTSSYVDSFQSVPVSFVHLFDFSQKSLLEFETGYLFVEKVFKLIFTDNVRFFFVFIGIVNYVVYIKTAYNILGLYEKEYFSNDLFLKSNKKYLIGVLSALFISYYGFMYSGIVLRQSFALSIYFIAFYFGLAKKYFLSIILLILSFFFHNMAILNIVILPFLIFDFNLKKITLYTLWFISFLLYLFKAFIFVSPRVSLLVLANLSDGFATIDPNKINSYLYENGYGASYSFSIIMHFVLTLFIIYNFNIKNKIESKIAHLYILSFCIMSLLAGVFVISRIFDYYFYTNSLLFYFFLSSKNIFKSILIFIIVFILNIFLFYKIVFFQ